MNLSYLFGYTTTKDLKEARTIGEKLVEEGLVACVNILPKIHSIYKWEDKVNSSTECVMIFKTTREQAPKVEETLLATHSYECPCLVFLPIETGYEKFLDWISVQLS